MQLLCSTGHACVVVLLLASLQAVFASAVHSIGAQVSGRAATDCSCSIDKCVAVAQACPIGMFPAGAAAPQQCCCSPAVLLLPSLRLHRPRLHHMPRATTCRSLG